jgi:hypothetical protein
MLLGTSGPATHGLRTSTKNISSLSAGHSQVKEARYVVQTTVLAP